jgi:hypothetical protein
MILICDAPSSTVCYLNARSQSLLPDRPSDPVTPRTLGGPALAEKILIALLDPRERRRLFGVALRRQDNSFGAAG